MPKTSSKVCSRTSFFCFGTASRASSSLSSALSDLRMAFCNSGVERSSSGNYKREDGRFTASIPSEIVLFAFFAAFLAERRVCTARSGQAPCPPCLPAALKCHPRRGEKKCFPHLQSRGFPGRHRNGSFSASPFPALCILSIRYTCLSIDAPIFTAPGFNIRNISENGICLRRTNRVPQGFQTERPVFHFLRHAGDTVGLPLPQDTSVHPRGKPISHSTQSGFSAAVSEAGCSIKITCADRLLPPFSGL